MSAIARKIVTRQDSDAMVDEVMNLMESRPRADSTDAGVNEKPAFKLFTLTPAECTMEPPRPYVVKGFIAQGDHVALIGQPGSGKSTLAPYIGYAVALGLPVFGCRTRQGPVLYLAAENASGIKMRVAALRATLGDTANFYVQPKSVDLLDIFYVAEVERLVQELQPRLIVIDTLAAAFPGLSENDAAEMSKVVGTIRRVAKWSDAAVLSLHHPPKTTEPSRSSPTTPRGSGVFLADLDGLLNIDGRGNSVRNVVVTKNRNGVSDIRFSFNLSAHHLGLDEDGDQITAPLAVPHSGNRDPRPSLKPQQLAAMEIIEALIADTGTPLPERDSFPADTHAVERTKAISSCAVDAVSGASRPVDRRVAASKIIDQLVNHGLLGHDHGLIWIVGDLG